MSRSRPPAPEDKLLIEQRRQVAYRDARTSGEYDDIWQSVGKCVFCDLREKYVFFEENGIVMTISLFAYIDGNFMIIPRRHVRSVKELTNLEWETIRKFIYIAKKIIKDVHGIKGVQYVLRDGGIVAQSTVSDHLHFHAIPFDAPDLMTWNYRQLKHTPLENVALYKSDSKKIISYATKFDKKYRNATSLPINCDLMAINEKNQVLLTERPADAQLIPNYMTMPGGFITDTTVPLVEELKREVYEETGYVIPTEKLQLIDSRIDVADHRIVSSQLSLSYKKTDRFLWNTYVLRGVSSRTKFTPGDDCEALVWIDLDDVRDNQHLSESTRDIIGKVIANGK